MTVDETFALLALAACFDQRTVGRTDAQGWHAVAESEGWTFELARRALVEHYGRHRERLMPSDITNRILQVRKQLSESFEIPRHSPELADDGPAFVAWARERKAEHMNVGLTEWAVTGQLPTVLAIEA
jgi:hypothetical protein